MASCSLFCNFYSFCSLLQLIKSQPSPACRFNRWTCIILGPFGIPLLLRSVAVLAFHQIAAGCVCSGPHAAIAANRRPPVAILGLSWAIFVWGCLGCLGFATAIWGCLEAFSRPLHIPFVRCFTIPTPLVHCFTGSKASPYPLADRVGGFATCWALWYFAVLALCRRPRTLSPSSPLVCMHVHVCLGSSVLELGPVTGARSSSFWSHCHRRALRPEGRDLGNSKCKFS